MERTKYPADFTPVVHSEIKRDYVAPSLQVLISLFETMYFASIKTEEAEPVIFNMIGGYLDDEHIPVDFYLEENTDETDLKHIRSEIDGVLWFISLLSRVDGLILMNKHLIVRGFGVEIKSAKPPEKIYICTRKIPSESSLKRVDYNHFGTRHRSMMRYCWNYSGAVGFVVSQDGDVRAMTKYDDKLIIWDNIRLQAYTFVSRKLIRRKRIKARK